MKQSLSYCIVLGLVLILAQGVLANPLPILDCGWEDGETVLGLFGTGDPPILATNVGAPDPVLSGDYSLRLEDNSPTGTPQAFVAYVWGLTDGQVITAGFWRYDDTPDGSPSCRIWAHWNDELPDNPDANSGSAGGNGEYGDGLGWDETTWEWTVADGHTGLVIEVRTYSGPGDTVWIDEMFIIPPDDCWVMTPCFTVVANATASFGHIKALYR